MASAADTEIIVRAKQEHSIIITADLDFPRLIALAGEGTPAVILFRPIRPLAAWFGCAHDEW